MACAVYNVYWHIYHTGWGDGGGGAAWQGKSISPLCSIALRDTRRRNGGRAAAAFRFNPGPPRSIDVLGRLLTTTLDTIYHFRRSPPFPGLSGLDMPSPAARTRSGATTAWRFSLSFFVFGNNTCGSPSGAVFFSLIHILGHGSSAFRALFVFLRSFVLMFIPFSTSNAKHCRLGASDTSIPPSHDETGFFFLFFFSYHNFHPPVFFSFVGSPS